MESRQSSGTENGSPTGPMFEYGFTAEVVDRVKFLAHIVSNTFNFDPDYGTPTFQRFQERLHEK